MVDARSDNKTVDLVVDLDGTLIATDLLWESTFQLLKQNMLYLFLLPRWALKGKGHLKHQISLRVAIDPAILPYRGEFVAYLREEHRSFIPDFGVYIRIQGSNGDVEYRSISRQLVLFCVERRKAWRMLQSKAGIENREYKAQRSLLADVDAGKVAKEHLFAYAEQLLKERMPAAGGTHKPAEPRVTPPPPAAAAAGSTASVS